MRRVVVTGLGVVSPIGNNVAEVTESLRDGAALVSCIARNTPSVGFRSHLHGEPKIDMDDMIDRKLRRFMGDGAAYAYVAMKEAIEDSGLGEDIVTNERTGLVMGSGGPSTSAQTRCRHRPRKRAPNVSGPTQSQKRCARRYQPTFQPHSTCAASVIQSPRRVLPAHIASVMAQS